MDPTVSEYLNLLFRWLHVIAGVMWIGHLWFFNFVNAQVAKAYDPESKKKILPELMPRARYFFRWGARYTWVTGFLLLGIVYYMGGVLLPSEGNQLGDNFGNGVGIGADGAGAGAAAQRTQAALDPLLFARQALHERLLQGNQAVAAHQHPPLFGKIERHHGNTFLVDVVPDVQLRPVGQGENAYALTRIYARVIKVPQFGPLVLRVPLAGAVAEGKDAVLGAGFFFIPPGSPEGGVEAVGA